MKKLTCSLNKVGIKRIQCNLDNCQNWLYTDLTYFQILITVLLFGIFVEYKIQEIWKRFKKEPSWFVYEEY